MQARYAKEQVQARFLGFLGWQRQFLQGQSAEVVLAVMPGLLHPMFSACHTIWQDVQPGAQQALIYSWPMSASS